MAHPTLVADPGVARADVGVAVVAIDAPRLEHTVGVPLFAGSTDVVHHTVLATLDEGGADLLADLGERLLPRDALPLARAALTDAAQREHDPLRVVDLVERGRPLGAVAAAAARMMRVALDLADFAGLFVVVSDEAAPGFTVEAGGGDKGVVLLDLVGPRLGVEFGPVVPLLGRRVLVEISHRFQLSASRRSGERDGLAGPDEGVFVGEEAGDRSDAGGGKRGGARDVGGEREDCDGARYD